jgi:hypothetical protein
VSGVAQGQTATVILGPVAGGTAFLRPLPIFELFLPLVVNVVARLATVLLRRDVALVQRQVEAHGLALTLRPRLSPVTGATLGPWRPVGLSLSHALRGLSFVAIHTETMKCVAPFVAAGLTADTLERWQQLVVLALMAGFAAFFARRLAVQGVAEFHGRSRSMTIGRGEDQNLRRDRPM